jgi:hypothetical protein
VNIPDVRCVAAAAAVFAHPLVTASRAIRFFPFLHKFFGLIFLVSFDF